MADTHATQGALLVLAGGGDARVTQTPLLALAGGAQQILATQAATLVLANIPTASVRATQGLALALAGEAGEGIRDTQSLLLVLARHVPCLTRWAQCWRIERRDGQVFNFTSHDRPVIFRGETYQPCHSLAASASELGTVLGAPGDVELAGIIADATITERDLYAGLFDRAAVEVWMVPWEDAGGVSPFRLTAGVAGNLSHGDEGFSMEVMTPGALLQQRPLLQAYTPGCRWELGDARCGVDLDALAVNGTVTALSGPQAYNAASRRVFFDAARAEADGYFDQGELVWTGGANTGVHTQIKNFASGRFVLWEPVVYNIQVGDAYEARPGCDKLPETCKNKYNNYANYGGFPDVPGKDAIMETPNSKG